MHDSITNYIKILSSLVEKKNGEQIRYVRQCSDLQKTIAKETGLSISDSTLKRFFGLVKSKFKPSKYTLDTLSVYVGFLNWDDFNRHYKQKNGLFIQVDSFLNKTNTENIHHYIQHINQKYHYPVSTNQTKNLDNFLLSDHKTFQITAPIHTGRQFLLHRYIKKLQEKNTPFLFFDLGNEKYKALFEKSSSDIINFLFNPLSLKQILSVKSKLVIVADISVPHQKNWKKKTDILFRLLIEEFKSFETIKFIFARSYKTDNKIIKTNISLDKKAFYYTHNQINSWFNQIFPDEEIISLWLAPSFVNFMRRPWFYHFYINNHKNQFLSLSILESYVNQLLEEPHMGETPNEVIKRFLYLVKYGKKDNIVTKTQLISDKVSENDLQRLVDIEFFEEKSQNQQSESGWLSIGSKTIYSFLIAEGWIKNNGLNSHTIEPLFFYYKDNPELLLDIFSWIIQYAIAYRQLDFFNRLLTKTNNLVLQTPEITKKQDFFLCILDHFFVMTRKSAEFRVKIIQNLIEKQTERKLFFEKKIDLDFLNMQNISEWNQYVLHENTPEANFIFAHFLFIRAFLSDEQEKAKAIFNEIEALQYLYLSDIHIATKYFTASLLIHNKKTSVILDKIEHYFHTNKEILDSNLWEDFYFKLAETLALVEKYTEASALIKSNKVFQKILDEKTYRSTILQLIEANNLVKTDAKAAFHFYQTTETLEDVPNMAKNYWAIRFFLLTRHLKKYSKHKLQQKNEYYAQLSIRLKFFFFKSQIYS